MASRALFKGSHCKGTCLGHRAGWNYAKGGGRTLTRSSTSFNSGVRIYLKQLPRRRR